MFKDLLPIYLIYLVGLLSPGPDFAIVIKNSFESQKKALFSAMGIVCGLMGHIAFSILGLGVVLQKSPALSQWIQIIGALYLGYLGFKIILNTKSASPVREKNLATEREIESEQGGFKEGFWVNILNPKAGMFIMSLFVQMIHAGKVWQAQFILGGLILMSSALWFSSVALFLNIPYVKAIFMKNVPVVEKLTAVMLIVFAALMLQKAF